MRTSTLKEENRIIVSVEAIWQPDRVPMDNTNWFNYGGLYRDVYLLRLPPQFIKRWFLHLQPDGRFTTLLFDVEVDEGQKVYPLSVRFRIEQLSIDRSVPTQEGKGSDRIPLTTPIELRSPEHPTLYPAEILLEDAAPRGSTKPNRYDQLQDWIGLREILTESGQILLNGKPIFLKGISLHEDHIELGKTTTPELIRA